MRVKLYTSPCTHCSKDFTRANHRFRMHEECKPLAKEAALSGMRRCSKCKKTKAASSFANDSTRIDGKFPWCSDCQSEGVRKGAFQDSTAELNGVDCEMCLTPVRGHANRKFCSNKCKERASALRKNYNLTPAQYRELVAFNNGKCPLCLKRIRLWNTDHNHRTGRVLGAVCTACNVGALAYSYHDIEYVERLLAFLKNPPADQLGIVAIAPESKPSQLHKRWQRGGLRRGSGR